jgi:hypothetical protein
MERRVSATLERDMGTFEHFYLVENGHGRWIIRHQITDILAGTILRTAGGFRLKNENARTVGNFASIEDAIQGLYATV